MYSPCQLREAFVRLPYRGYDARPLPDDTLDPPEEEETGKTCEICGDLILVGQEVVDLDFFNVTVHEDCLTDISHHYTAGFDEGRA